eukprot:CAMPEP_0183739040 /NCGR_PEP_ID=MMETSP0737-20130205/56076_1 /TAXON_ID=385413 /ORGANISM="Thalassiosira miniscula, Strain CCMP1093" /LENGTH=296 /DNA_ID=CAMNT_0025973723 /DNA_START=370 /DNA_END=1260 /DNA_ORIENTATION=+
MPPTRNVNLNLEGCGNCDNDTNGTIGDTNVHSRGHIEDIADEAKETLDRFEERVKRRSMNNNMSKSMPPRRGIQTGTGNQTSSRDILSDKIQEKIHREDEQKSRRNSTSSQSTTRNVPLSSESMGRRDSTSGETGVSSNGEDFRPEPIRRRQSRRTMLDNKLERHGSSFRNSAKLSDLGRELSFNEKLEQRKRQNSIRLSSKDDICVDQSGECKAAETTRTGLTKEISLRFDCIGTQGSGDEYESREQVLDSSMELSPTETSASSERYVESWDDLQDVLKQAQMMSLSEINYDVQA